MVTNFLGTICPWGLNWLGTICPEEPINWGPNVRGPYVFGTKCVTANILSLFDLKKRNVYLVNIFRLLDRNWSKHTFLSKKD